MSSYSSQRAFEDDLFCQDLHIIHPNGEAANKAVDHEHLHYDILQMIRLPPNNLIDLTYTHTKTIITIVLLKIAAMPKSKYDYNMRFTLFQY
jgi:hypothetical protein